MQEKIQQFRDHVIEVSGKPQFIHHKWFVTWHLEIVDQLAKELLEFYPEADKNLVEVLVWLHDYGKTQNYADQYETTKKAGREKLTEIGFPAAFVDRAIEYAGILDQKMKVDLHRAPIEVQIVSTADGCSHMIGPFMSVFWHYPTEKTFEGKTLEEMMELNVRKIEKDWSRKIVLPEARKAFEVRKNFLLEQSGELPERFFK